MHVLSVPVTPGLVLLFALDSLGTAECRSLFLYTDKTDMCVTRITTTTPPPQRDSTLSVSTPAHKWTKHREKYKNIIQTWPMLTETKKRKTGLKWRRRRVPQQQTWRAMLQLMESHTDEQRECVNAIESHIHGPRPRGTRPVTDASMAALLAKSHIRTRTLSTERTLPETLLLTASRLPQTQTLSPGSCRMLPSPPGTKPRGTGGLQQRLATTGAPAGTESIAGAVYR